MLVNFGKLLIMAAFFWIWMVFARSYYVCEIKGICDQQQALQDSTMVSKLPKTLQVKAGLLPVLSGFPEFHFDHGSTAPLWSTQHLDLLEQLAEKLKNQTGAKLKIEGRYLKIEKENNLGRYDNLGRARAMSIADKLIAEYKVSPTQLMAIPRQLNDSVLKAPITFELMGYIPSDGSAMQKQEAIFERQWKSNSILRVTYDARMSVLRNPTSRFSLAPPVFDTYVDSLKNYLKQYESAKLLLLGHTDSKLKGTPAKTEALKFAKNMRTYLQEAGVVNEIKVETRSNKERVAIDKLPGGDLDPYEAAKNRRVEILIVDVK